MTKNNTNSTSYEAILKEASKQGTNVYRFSKTYPAYIVLILALAMSFAAWYFFDQKVKSDQDAAFDKAVTSVMTRFEIKYKEDLNVLTSMRGLYDEYVQVVRDIFELYGTQPIKSQPSVSTVVFAPRVFHKDYDWFIHYVRSEGYYYYTDILPKGKRDVYHPIELIVPLEGNMHRSGHDFNMEAETKAAIYKAMDSNLIVSTGIYELRRPDTVGFYLVSPVYHRDSTVETVEQRRNSYQGALFIEIDSKKFFEEALGSGVASDTAVVFQCFDTDSEGKKFKVFESENASLLNTGYTPELINTRNLKIADREILVEFNSIPNFGGSFQKLIPIAILVVAFLISIAFFLFLLSVITRKARAVELAERMTRSQRRIVDSSKDIIAVLDLDYKWKSMNPAAETIFGYTPDHMIDNTVDELFIEEKDKNHFHSFIEKTADEQTSRLAMQMISKEGEHKWIDWSLTVSRTDQLVYCIGRDITLEKLAEEAAILRRKQNQLTEQLTREASTFKSYFMIKLSHQLRNSLTGIIGYLQLLSQKIYEDEAEQDFFVGEAEKSSEELFTIVSELHDVAGVDESKTEDDDISVVSVYKVFDQAEKATNEKLEDQTVKVTLMEESGDPKVLADSERMKDTLLNIFTAFSDGLENSDIQIMAIENTYEGATEIQILGPGNERVEKMINIYKKTGANVIDMLQSDENDIILKLETAASNIRMMNGTFKVETFGGQDGNVAMINLPLNKQQ